MGFIKKLFVGGTFIAVAAVAAVASFAWWANQPITEQQTPMAFVVLPGSGVSMASQRIAAAGVPLNSILFSLLARVTQNSLSIKAGSYELAPGTSPRRLLDQMVRGEFAHESLTIIEGWTFKQMRQAIAGNQGLNHETSALSDHDLMAKVSADFTAPEGLFFPDTYLFPKGSNDLVIYKQAHAMLLAHLNTAWDKRDPSLPYKTPYQALVMASIVEKETGQKSERTLIAGVFVNRLKLGMLLQTDPTVIYGMGAHYNGKIRKRDLETDTPYNTYTRAGLPPTPIALPGIQSLDAALGPAKTDALYFVSRGDGTSQFSGNLVDHNRAVHQFQR